MPGSFIEKLLTSAKKNDRSYLVLVSGQQGIGKAQWLGRWNPALSDFIILRDFVTLSYPAPVTKELLEKIREFSPKRVGDRVEVTVPVFEVVYNSTWAGDDMKIDDAVVVAPHIDDASDEQIINSILQEFAAPGEE